MTTNTILILSAIVALFGLGIAATLLLMACLCVSSECSREEEQRSISLFEKDECGDLTFRALPPLKGYWPLGEEERGDAERSEP